MLDAPDSSRRSPAIVVMVSKEAREAVTRGTGRSRWRSRKAEIEAVQGSPAVHGE